MAEEFKYSSLFGDLTKEVQVRFDAASRLNKLLYDNVIYPQYLSWDFPSIGFDFEEIKGKYNITIAAATVDQNSKEPILITHGLDTIKETILTHMITLPLTINDRRRIYQLMDSKRISDDTKRRQLIELMWGTIATPMQGVQAKLDIIFLQALSNKGVATLDSTNNPEGGIKTTIDYNMPASNQAIATVPWTAANLLTVDVFEDIQAVVDAAKEKVVFEKILITPARLSYILKSKVLKQVIFGTDKQNGPLLVQRLNEFMQLNELPYFEVMRRQVNIQHNGKLTPYNPWNPNNLVFVPPGNLGIIKNAFADGELDPEPGVAYSYYGRIQVAQWKVGETQNSKGVEFVKAEVNALPVLTEIDGIYSLEVE